MSSYHDLRGVWSKRQEMAGTDHPGWRLNNLTTTQRDALTGSGAAKTGDVIFNTTTGTLETYGASAWQSGGGYNSSNVGTVTTAATTAVVEYGSDIDHVTKLTMTAFSLGTCGDNASLGIGAKFYTFPAGAIVVSQISMLGALTAVVSVTAQTPEIGIGSAVATGAVAVLSGNTTFEEYIDGNTSGGTNGATVATDINGTAFYKLSRNNLDYIIKTSGGVSHDLFLNAAVAWADVVAAAALKYTGVIIIKWRIIS